MATHPDIRIIRARRKTLSLHVMPDKTVLVKAPWYVPMWSIQSFIAQHEAWIQKKLHTLHTVTHTTDKKYEEGEKFLYLGETYTLTYGPYPDIQFKNGKLLFPLHLKFRAKKEIESWYIKEAKRIITQQVKYYAKEMDVSFGTISFSDTKSKWGSCTHDDKLQFNWRLVMASLLVINYVVIHELAHTMEKNHSEAFWSIVRHRTPSYRQQRKWLKIYGDTLTL